VVAASIRLLLADDHRLFADALRAVLAADERMDVVGYAKNGEEAVELATTLRPDVTLMDIAMPILDGVEATRRIRAALPGACVVMVTGSNSPADVRRAREAGAAGYVTKDRIAVELVEAILKAGSD
jgi:DNA-binding NarL/FixJ family response regulator